MSPDTEPSDAFMEGVWNGALRDLPPRQGQRLGSVVVCLVWVNERQSAEHGDHVDHSVNVEFTTWGPVDGVSALETARGALNEALG